MRLSAARPTLLGSRALQHGLLPTSAPERFLAKLVKLVEPAACGNDCSAPPSLQAPRDLFPRNSLHPSRTNLVDATLDFVVPSVLGVLVFGFVETFQQGIGMAARSSGGSAIARFNSSSSSGDI